MRKGCPMCGKFTSEVWRIAYITWVCNRCLKDIEKFKNKLKKINAEIKYLNEPRSTIERLKEECFEKYGAKFIRENK